MGTDIHLHTEIKIGGKWLHYSNPTVERNYRLFSFMAGVRSCEGIVPLSAPKGLPDDLSDITKMDRDLWEGDAHSDSYLGADELVKLEHWASLNMKWTTPGALWGYLFRNSWATFTEYREEIPAAVEDIRFVFWFDC